jgi:peptide/nickel transport system substrate-binding protein
MWNSSQVVTALTRRRFLQGTMGSVAGLVAWQGWPRLRSAMAQKGEPSGEMTWAIHVNIAPTWFDPAETTGIITPYMFMYAMHDALVKPMPDNPMSPSLATKWSESADGLTYDFELRQGVKFHNGDPFTAEDVKYSFERYNGAGWIVPKNYTEKIGSEKFKEQPIGLGPYRFASYQPGVELVLEANPDYWRKTPHVKRLVMKSVPEATTRLAMLKKQEADVTYGLYGALGEEVLRDPNLKLEPVGLPGTQWIVFAEYYHDPKSPWADKRVRLAANHAINRQAINEAETLGHSVLSGNIIPRKFEYALALEPYAYDPKKAKQLLKEAGYANGFDAGECGVDNVYAGVIEAMMNDLTAVGIRAKVRPMERAAHQAALKEKTLRHLAFQGSGAFGNASTRLDAFATSKGAQSWIKDPEIDTWYEQQAVERDRKKREALLHKIQQKLYDEALFISMWELGFLCASGPRAAVSGLSLIPLFAYSGPYEDVQLKS